ncbi:MAG: hypothetical protein ACM3UV_05995 [Nocardioidaceae bacterium]
MARSSKPAGQVALDRLGDSIEAAQAALKDLRSEMSRGSRELLKDVDTTLRNARKNLRGANRKIIKDLEGVQKAVTGSGSSTSRRTAARSTSRSASSRSASAGRSSASRSGGRSASTARRKTSTKK